MNNSVKSESPLSVKLKGAPLWIFLIGGLMFAVACGSAGPSSGPAAMYPAGSKTDEDVDRELKFDARVQSYEADGNKLLVEVNESFASSPPGIQQRALSHWYSLWQAARTPENAKPQATLEVVVRYEGNDLAKWTGNEGFKVTHAAKTESET